MKDHVRATNEIAKVGFENILLYEVKSVAFGNLGQIPPFGLDGVVGSQTINSIYHVTHLDKTFRKVRPDESCDARD